MSGESGVPLHLKIKAYHVDIARGDTQRPRLKMDDIITMVVPRQLYLKSIDPDGTRLFDEVRAEVKTMTSRYYHLVHADPTTEKHRAEVACGLISTLDVYESFHLILKQPTWAAEDERVKLSDEEGGEEEDEGDKLPRPPQTPASCTCKWCCKWTVCQHTSLVASVFSPAYKVPDKLVAETPALRKKTNSIRGTAGLKRKVLVKEIVRQKSLRRPNRRAS